MTTKLFVLYYFPTLRSQKFMYEVTTQNDTGYVLSDEILTLDDVSHLGVTAIQDASDKGWMSPN